MRKPKAHHWHLQVLKRLNKCLESCRTMEQIITFQKMLYNYNFLYEKDAATISLLLALYKKTLAMSELIRDTGKFYREESSNLRFEIPVDVQIKIIMHHLQKQLEKVFLDAEKDMRVERIVFKSKIKLPTLIVKTLL